MTFSLQHFISTLTEKQIERFWSHVDKTPGYGPNKNCWKWTGDKWGTNSSASHKTGYGVFKANYNKKPKGVSVHRMMLFLVGRPFNEVMECAHSCDVSDCCNPDHLSPKTRRQNLAEAYQRNRFPSKTPKVTQAEIKLMKRKLASGMSIEAIADDLGRQRETVRRRLQQAGVYDPPLAPSP